MIKGRVGSLLGVGAGFHQELTCLRQAGRAGEHHPERRYPFDRLRTGLGMKKAEIDRKFDENERFRQKCVEREK